MEQPKKNFNLVSNKNSRIILPNIFTLVGVCIGLSSIKFAFDGNLDNPYLPENIKDENWIVYTGTHDNSTSKGWRSEERV